MKCKKKKIFLKMSKRDNWNNKKSKKMVIKWEFKMKTLRLMMILIMEKKIKRKMINRIKGEMNKIKINSKKKILIKIRKSMSKKTKKNKMKICLAKNFLKIYRFRWKKINLILINLSKIFKFLILKRKTIKINNNKIKRITKTNRIRIIQIINRRSK